MQLHVTTFVGISLALKLFQDLDHVPHHVMFWDQDVDIMTVSWHRVGNL